MLFKDNTQDGGFKIKSGGRTLGGEGTAMKDDRELQDRKLWCMVLLKLFVHI